MDVALYKRHRPDLLAACKWLSSLSSLTIVAQTQILLAWGTRRFRCNKIYECIAKLMENNRTITNLNVDLCGYFSRDLVANWLTILPNLKSLSLDMFAYQHNTASNNKWTRVASRLKHLKSITLGYSWEMARLGWPRYRFGISLHHLLRGSMGKRLTCLWMAQDVSVKKYLDKDDKDDNDFVINRIVKIAAKCCPLLETFVCCFPGFDSQSPLTIQVSNDGLKLLTTSCPRLKHLALHMCHGVGDDGLSALSKLQQLEVVSLRSATPSAKGIVNMLQECKTLKSLLLPNSWLTPLRDEPSNIDIANPELANSHLMRYIDYQRISDETFSRMHGLWIVCETDQSRLDIVKNAHPIPFMRLDHIFFDDGEIHYKTNRSTFERDAFHATHAPMSAMDVLRRFVIELNPLFTMH